jgi:hypothetical protein
MRFPNSSNARKVRSRYGGLSEGQISRQQPQPKSRDNNALIITLIAFLGIVVAQSVTACIAERGLAAQRELEEERAREAELQTYLDDIGQMLLDEDNSLARKAASPSDTIRNDPMSALSRAKTLAIFERSDALRKRIILQFLSQSQLIRRDEPAVSLRGVNLSGIDLSDTNLRLADLSFTNLSGANLSDVALSDARLDSADLSGADLSGANLSIAEGVTDDQLAEAKTLKEATMPEE